MVFFEELKYIPQMDNMLIYTPLIDKNIINKHDLKISR